MQYSSPRSPQNLSPRERVEIALHGGHAGCVPFTIYEGMLPQCSVERALRDRGLCLVYRIPVVRTYHPNVKIHREVYWVDRDREMTRTYYETPVGTLTTLDEAADFTAWHHEKMLKSPDDYKALLFLINDEVYEPDYAAFAEAERQAGDDAIFRASFGLEPLQDLISGSFMKMQAFCYEWMERRDEILKLYAALVEKRRIMYRLVAESPAGHANYGGNVVPEIIGRRSFQQYYVPHYNEAAEIMHKQGKLIGCHFDANTRLIAKDIADTDLDYIEAFTPAPDTDMSLAEARQAWPNKVLWLNFPSSIHLKPDAEVKKATLSLLEEAGTPDGLLMGITENVPKDRWQGSLRAIMDGLTEGVAEQQHPA
jgi:hypothetical protein